jgi:predicted nucleic acid-binding protein
MARSVVIANAGPQIALALHQQACGERVVLIMDDRCGRAEARRQILPILGTAAVLVQAKERN